MYEPNKLKQSLKRALPAAVLGYIRRARNVLFDPFAVRSYSQEGEDMILRRIFEGRSKGFYIDVGAHHPRRFSNTYLFYRMGWSGINIDATPESMKHFRKQRPRDTNIEAAVSRERGELTFYLYNDPALNSFARRSFADTSRYQILGERKLTTSTLEELLSQHLPPGQSIDFLSVDVEGMDLEVLISNDWQRFRPECVLVECREVAGVDQLPNNDTACLLREQGYALLAKTLNTLIFRDVLTTRSAG